MIVTGPLVMIGDTLEQAVGEHSSLEEKRLETVHHENVHHARKLKEALKKKVNQQIDQVEQTIMMIKTERIEIKEKHKREEIEMKKEQRKVEVHNRDKQNRKVNRLRRNIERR